MQWYDGNLRDTDINSMVPANYTTWFVRLYAELSKWAVSRTVIHLLFADEWCESLRSNMYLLYIFVYLQTKNVLESPNRSHLINHYIGTPWLWFTVKHKIDPSKQHFTTWRISHAEEFSGMHWICYASIWYLWSFWNVYVSNTIKQMLMGKSVLRGVRGHMIEDYVFRILLILTF